MAPPTTATVTKHYLKILLHFISVTSRLFQPNYPGTKVAGAPFELRKRMKNSPSSAKVLHKTLNLVISRCCFAEDGKEMYQNVKRTCRAIVSPHYTYCLKAFSLPWPLL